HVDHALGGMLVADRKGGAVGGGGEVHRQGGPVSQLEFRDAISPARADCTAPTQIRVPCQRTASPATALHQGRLNTTPSHSCRRSYLFCTCRPRDRLETGFFEPHKPEYPASCKR